ANFGARRLPRTHHRSPDDIHALGLEERDRLFHILDLEGDEVVAEVKAAGRRRELGAVIGDKFDRGAAQFEIDEVDALEHGVSSGLANGVAILLRLYVLRSSRFRRGYRDSR